MKSDKLILFLTALGFLGLFIDIRYNHAAVLSENAVAYIPLVATGLGFLAALAGLAAEKKLATICGITLILVALVGPVGIYYHTEGQFSRLSELLKSNVRQERLARQKGAMDGPLAERPLLAPMSVTGLGLIGAICLFGSKRR